METPPSFSSLLSDTQWAMLPGERAALEGLLSMLRPSLSIEIGIWRGGSLDLVSRHSEVVHAFDLERKPEVTAERFPNVTFHIGDSHELLPAVLAELDRAERNVDFVFVDGDHSAHGVRQDLEDLLRAACSGQTVILLHDTLNERVRAGIEEIDLERMDGVRFVDLDFVQGRVMREGPQKDELWYGLGMIVTGWKLDDASWPPAYAGPQAYAALSEVLVSGGAIDQRLGYQQLVEVESWLEDQRRLTQLMKRSWSWRITSPLRRAKGLIRRDRPAQS